jgi:uncharacterized protein (TIGR03382 family)
MASAATVSDFSQRPAFALNGDRPAVAYAAIALLVALIMAPVVNGPPLFHDSFWIDHSWASQFTAELRSGQLLPRWMPLANGGLGSPVFYYYPPLAFYVTGLFGLVGLDTWQSIVAAFAAAFFVSGVATWHWLRGWAPSPLLGALFFTAAPYHVFDCMRRGALAESVAIALVPLVALSLRRISDGRGFLPGAFAYAALIATHLPLALLTSVMLIAPYALRHRSALPGFAQAVGFGIGLAAITLVPALMLEPFRDSSHLWNQPFLRPDYWSVLTQVPFNGFRVQVHLTAGALALACGFLLLRFRSGWAGYGLALCALAAGLLPFVWHLPLLGKVQFPYRALPLAEFGLATALAFVPASGRLLALAAAAPALLLSAQFAQRPEGATYPTLLKLHPDVPEYLPPGVLNRALDVSAVQDHLVPYRNPPSISGKVVEAHFYFPAWSCGTAEPRTKLLMHDPSCTPKIVRTKPEKLGAAISLAALLLLAGAALVRRRKPLSSAPPRR